MKLLPVVAIVTSLSVLGVASAFAQTAAPAATPAPAATMAPATGGAMAPAGGAMKSMTKAQMATSCSKQATAKKLKVKTKARTSYISACEKNDGKGA